MPLKLSITTCSGVEEKRVASEERSHPPDATSGAVTAATLTITTTHRLVVPPNNLLLGRQREQRLLILRPWRALRPLAKPDSRIMQDERVCANGHPEVSFDYAVHSPWRMQRLALNLLVTAVLGVQTSMERTAHSSSNGYQQDTAWEQKLEEAPLAE